MEFRHTIREGAKTALMLGYVGAATLGGYRLLESVNNTPQAELQQALNNEEASRDAYVALAPNGSCEAIVLRTMVAVQVVDNKPRSSKYTTEKLDIACGVDPAHAALGSVASKKYKAILSAKSQVEDVIDSSKYAWDEKLLGIAGPITLTTASLSGLDILATRISRRRKAREPKPKSRFWSPQGVPYEDTDIVTNA